MKKLRLDPESLRVESFAAGAAAAGGTVVGHFDAVGAPVDDDTSRIDSCYFNTCYDTCDWTD